MAQSPPAPWVAWLICLLLSAAARGAAEPDRQAPGVKPPWQRPLQGEAAKKADEQQRQFEQLQKAGKLEAALKVAEGLARLRSTAQGADHWQAVDARFAVEALRRALEASSETQQSYLRTFALQAQGEELVAQGRYREAQPVWEQTLSIHRKVLGEEHPDTAVCYINLAHSKNAQSKFEEAEEGYRKALAIVHKTLGADHPVTATAYNSLASSLYELGKYQEAEKGFSRALIIRQKVLGEEHPDTAESCHNLAFTQHSQGKYQEADKGYRRSLAIFRKVLGEDNPTTARSYGSTAANLDAQGKHKEAEESHFKALTIFRKALGEEHPDTATCYTNLAANLNARGKYKEAEESLRKALATFRKVLGEEHPETATCYNNLAANLNFQGRYEEADRGYRKALAIRQKVLGEEHPDTATSYDNVATNLDAQSKYREAEESYRKALAIWRKILGEEHPDTARCYDNVAGNLNDQGKLEEADRGYRKALAIRQKVLGEEHPDTATSYNNLAYNLYAQGKYLEAEQSWLRSARVFAGARLHIATSGLERASRTSEQSPLPMLAAVLARNGKPNDAWQRFEESLARGTWDDLSARLRRAPAEREQQAQMAARIDRLDTLLQNTPQQSRQRRQLLTQLRQARDELADFAQRLEQKYGPVAGQVYSRPQIQAALPADTALVAWLDLRIRAKAADPNGEHWAVLLRSVGDPIWVRLPGSGAGSSWTDADTRLPAQVGAALQSPSSTWQPLAQRLRKQRLEPLAAHLKGLRRLIVLPSTALAGVPVEVFADGYTVSYAHSGTMFAYLRPQPAARGKGLLALADPIFEAPDEKEKPQPLPPGGVLLTMVAPDGNAAQAGLRPNDVLLRYGNKVLAGPADLQDALAATRTDKPIPVTVWREGRALQRPVPVPPGKLGVVIAEQPAPQALTEQRRWDLRLGSRSGDDGKWAPLPGTRFEAAALQRLFAREPSQLLLDADASEQRLNDLARSGALVQYRYVHLATHGDVNDTFPLRSAVILARDRLPDDRQRTELLESGQPIPDGRLTAQEVLERWRLDSDLVTLSACQTALGKYEHGEGFVGFAQALILAGSRSVCLSLWKVDDAATALLMERFYQNLLGKRKGLKAPLPRAGALAEAKAWLRQLSREEALARAAQLSQGVVRSKGRKLQPLKLEPAAKDAKDRPFAHPYYWAAFVLIGQAD